MKRMIKHIIYDYYRLKLFTEGQGVRDKAILFALTIPRVIGYAIGLMNSAAGRAFYNLAVLKLSPDVTVENRDGLFYCRKGRGDAPIVAEGYEHSLRKYFEEVKSGVFIDV